jgi:hypothetical protein
MVLPTLQSLMDTVRTEAGGNPTTEFRVALSMSVVLRDLGDELLSHFAKNLGLTDADARWASIADEVGLSNEEARERFTSLDKPGRELGLSRDRLGERSRRVLVDARAVARTRSHASVHPEHLLIAIVEDDERPATRALARCGVSPDRVRQVAEDGLGGVTPAAGTSRPGMSKAMRNVLDGSLGAALEVGAPEIGPEHLVLAVIQGEDSNGRRLAGALGIEAWQYADAVLAECGIRRPTRG